MMPAPMKPMFLGVGASEAIVTTERVDLERTGFRTGLERLRGGRGCARNGGCRECRGSRRRDVRRRRSALERRRRRARRTSTAT